MGGYPGPAHANSKKAKQEELNKVHGCSAPRAMEAPARRHSQSQPQGVHPAYIQPGRGTSSCQSQGASGDLGRYIQPRCGKHDPRLRRFRATRFCSEQHAPRPVVLRLRNVEIDRGRVRHLRGRPRSLWRCQLVATVGNEERSRPTAIEICDGC